MYVSLEPCCHHGRTPPCTDAILEAGIARVVVASDDPTEKASGRGLGILRDEGVEVVVADGELAARARLLNQPFRKHARTGRPFVLLQVGDDARRQGRHPHRRLEVDLRRGLARARAPLARRVRRRRRRDRHRAGRRPAADRPRSRAPSASRAAWSSTPRRACRSTPARPRRRGTLPLTVVVSRAAPRAATDALEAAGAEVIVATGENEPARVRSALDQLGAARHHLDPARGRPAPRGRLPRRRRGRRDAPLHRAGRCSAARGARDPLEGEGVERIAEATRALTLDVRARRRRRAGLRAAAGVVRVFTGLVQDLGTVTAVDATADGVRLAVRDRAGRRDRPGDSVAVNGVCLTATRVPDGEFSADVMHETLRRSSLAEVGDGTTVNLELPLRAPTGSAAMSSRATSTASAPSASRATTASPASSRSPCRPSCCATSSRRARSPSTASR